MTIISGDFKEELLSIGVVVNSLLKLLRERKIAVQVKPIGK